MQKVFQKRLGFIILVSVLTYILWVWFDFEYKI